MTEYYDYDPVLRLSRPLALVSFVNQFTRAAAHSFTSTSGLPLRVLDDLIEHRMSSAERDVAGPPDLQTWRRHEREVLIPLLRSRPPAVIALGEGALSDEDVLKRVLKHADLIYLYLSFDVAGRLARRQPTKQRATFVAELAADDAFDDDSVLELFTRRRSGYERAHHVIDVHRLSPRAIGSRIADIVASGPS